MRFRVIVDGEAHELDVEGKVPRLVVRVDGVTYRARVERDSEAFRVRIGNGRHRVVIRGHLILVDGSVHDVVAEPLGADQGPSAGGERPGSGGLVEIRPPMPGRIVKLPVAAGDRVKRGQTLAVLEAMKMQNEIPAPADGIVRSVSAREGESISADRVIAVLEAR